jgi:hypothetical protein
MTETQRERKRERERERERSTDTDRQTEREQDGKGKENCDRGGTAGIWARVCGNRVPEKRLVHALSTDTRMV